MSENAETQGMKTVEPDATGVLPHAAQDPLLTNQEIEGVRELLVEVNMDLDILLASVEPEVRAQLPVTGRLGDDLHSILHELVRMERLENGEVPLAEILKAAADLREDRHGMSYLRNLRTIMLDRLARREGSPPPQIESLSPIDHSPPPQIESLSPIDRSPPSSDAGAAAPPGLSRHRLAAVLGCALAVLASLVSLARKPASPRGCRDFDARNAYVESRKELEASAEEIVYLSLRPPSVFASREYLEKVTLPLAEKRWDAVQEQLHEPMAARGEALRDRLANNELSRVTVLLVTDQLEEDLALAKTSERPVIAGHYLDFVATARRHEEVIFVCSMERRDLDLALDPPTGAVLLTGRADEHLARTVIERGLHFRICAGAQNLALSQTMRQMADACHQAETKRTLDALEEVATSALSTLE